jgi:ATP-dependent DNA helicase RecQ
MESGLLEINETMNCKLVPRRFCEANYMVNHGRNDFALHIIFEGLRNLLSECKQGKVRLIGQDEREQIYKHLMDDVIYDDIIEENIQTANHFVISKKTKNPFKSLFN